MGSSNSPDASERPRPVALVGLRGAGKTTLGRALAARLGRPFVDLDEALAERHGAGEAAGAVLRRVGEARFRELEREVLLAALARADAPVIATGGGVVERADNRADLVAGSRCVWLRGDPGRLAARVAADGVDRPPLTDLDPAAELRLLAARRAPRYAEVAALILDVDDGDVPALVERIFARLER